MKTIKLNIVLSVIIATVVITSCSKSDDLDQSFYDANSKDFSENLSGPELQGLIFLGDKQKLHRDFYLASYRNTNNELFEQLYLTDQHLMDLIVSLLDKYGENKTLINLGVGDFLLEDTQVEYDMSVQSNDKGVEQTIATAIQMEKVMLDNIQMYMDLVEGNEDIVELYTNMLTELYSKLYILEAKIGGLEV